MLDSDLPDGIVELVTDRVVIGREVGLGDIVVTAEKV
jgi:hypothetical protein